MSVRLEDLTRCFQGVVPSLIATCSLDGEPNVTYLSQVYYVDARRVALSCQFFNKTRRNVAENPWVSITLYDPLTFEAYRLRLRFEHSETEGALFDTMAARIQVIASHTGMAGVFRLIAADVYEVLSVEAIDGFLLAPDPVLDAAPLPASGGPLTEVRSLQVVSDRIARASSLAPLLDGALTALDELFGFSHAMILLAGGDGRLATAATRGYGACPAEIQVDVGSGLIGTVAELRRMVRVSGVGSELRYGRTIRSRVEAAGGGAQVAPEVPLPGLADAQAQLALPLLSGDRLVGVLALESLDPLGFDDWDEAFLQILANQIAAGIESVRERPAAPARQAGTPVRQFTFYRNDDCVFLDREYLVRNVPGRILWKLLRTYVNEGRSEFTNRELRLDPSLGLPRIKDNLESRLILLRRRLAERCPEARLVPNGRGRFSLELDFVPELSERDSA